MQQQVHARNTNIFSALGTANRLLFTLSIQLRGWLELMFLLMAPTETDFRLNKLEVT